MVSCVAVAVVIAARWKRASPPRRRAMLPSVAGISSLLFFAAVQQADTVAVAWLAVCSLLTIPAAFLAGLLRSRLARGSLTELFRDLRTMRGRALESRLGRALGDPELTVAYPLPTPPGMRTSTVVPSSHAARRAGRRAGGARRPRGRRAVYDASLDDDPELVEAVTAAAGIALEHQELHAESRPARRDPGVAAADRRRGRHGAPAPGAQPPRRRAAAARRARAPAPADPRRHPHRPGGGRDAGHERERRARAVARGAPRARARHPPRRPPSRASTRRSRRSPAAPGPAGVACEPPSTARPVALGRVLRGLGGACERRQVSQAQTASVRLSCTKTSVTVEIADDGIGGADAAAGSGLRGLEDRVQALDGRLLVTSPPGGGTVVTAELPCAS